MPSERSMLGLMREGDRSILEAVRGEMRREVAFDNATPPNTGMIWTGLIKRWIGEMNRFLGEEPRDG